MVSGDVEGRVRVWAFRLPTYGTALAPGEAHESEAWAREAARDVDGSDRNGAVGVESYTLPPKEASRGGHPFEEKQSESVPMGSSNTAEASTVAESPSAISSNEGDETTGGGVHVGEAGASAAAQDPVLTVSAAPRVEEPKLPEPTPEEKLKAVRVATAEKFLATPLASPREVVFGILF